MGILARSIAILAALVLQTCTERSPEPYFQQLKSQDLDERRRAAYELLRFDKEEVVPRLLQEARSKDARVRLIAVQLLGKFRDRRGAPVLIAALDDETEFVAEKAAWALGELRDVDTAPALAAALEHRSADVVGQALESLQALRAPVALASLLALAGGASGDLRRQAVAALGACHSYELEPVLSDSAHRMVLRTLDDPDPQMCIAAMLGAHEFGYRGAVEAIVDRARDRAPEVRHVAVQALGQIAAGEAPNAPAEVDPQTRAAILEALVHALGDTAYQSIRTKAIRALGASGDSRAQFHLERLLERGSEADLMEAKWALEKLLIDR